jgi:hypothetical protein
LNVRLNDIEPGRARRAVSASLVSLRRIWKNSLYDRQIHAARRHIHSIVGSALRAGIGSDIHLYFGVRGERDLYLEDQRGPSAECSSRDPTTDYGRGSRMAAAATHLSTPPPMPLSGT